MSQPQKPEGRNYATMTLPYGQNRRDVRDNFARSSGGIAARKLYDSDSPTGPRPSQEEIEKIFREMGEDEVLILLGSNAYTTANELLSYVIFTAEGWRYLITEGFVYPKVLKRTTWQAVQHSTKLD